MGGELTQDVVPARRVTGGQTSLREDQQAHLPFLIGQMHRDPGSGVRGRCRGLDEKRHHLADRAGRLRGESVPPCAELAQHPGPDPGPGLALSPGPDSRTRFVQRRFAITTPRLADPEEWAELNGTATPTQ